MKRLVVLTICFAAAFVFYMGCGETTTGPGVAGGYYLGAEACRQCHSTAYNSESQTKHFNTFVDDPNNPYDFFSIWQADGSPSTCLACHTTGYDTAKDNHGADEQEYYKERLGITCENCHGPGSEHVAGGGDPSKITLDYSAELCGGCHTGSHHPTYEEWETSGHADALVDLKDSGFGQDSCLECHSADYWYDRSITLDSAQYGIECVMCHQAHGSNFESQLREEKEKLCALCHYDEGAQPPSTPHHPQNEMLSGTGGYEWPQGGYYPSSPHNWVVEERCVACHMYAQPVDDQHDAITGHSWNPDVRVCQDCHDGATDFDIDGAQTNIGNLLTQLKAELNQQQNMNDQNYLNAKFDYNFVNNDKSTGVHNYLYAKKLLDDSIAYYTPSSYNYGGKPPVAHR